METYMLRYHPAEVTPTGRWLLTGFIAGALSVLIFHQGAFALMNLLDFTHRPLYSATATAPLGIPSIWSLAFWGGVWGLLFAGFVVAPIKGQPIAAGAVPMAMAAAVIANAAWGFGTALGLELFGRPRRVGTAPDLL
jgi:hypothetical protein